MQPANDDADVGRDDDEPYVMRFDQTEPRIHHVAGTQFAIQYCAVPNDFPVDAYKIPRA